MNRILIAVAALVIACPLNAQNLFTLLPSSLTKMANSQACWGDYDQDGDLDVVIAGETATSTAVTKLFRNDAGVFTEAPSTLPGVHYPSLDWADFDLDGDPDLLLTGLDSAGIPITRIIKSKYGNLTVTALQLPGIYGGQAVWGDFDNDNDPDILLAGIGTDGFFTARILRNDNGTAFTDIGAPLTGVQSASVAWVDFNNDGWLDASLNGDSGGGMVTKLYRNDHGTFTEVPFAFAGLGSGQIKWADLDNDGDADMLECGMDINIDGHIYIYRNDGNEQFTMMDAVDNNLISSSTDIGDYDNDGWMDFMVIGVVPGCGGSAVALLNRNMGGLNFFDVSTLIPGVKNGSVMWGDYNNDGWSDLLFTGFDSYNNYSSSIYRNLGGNDGFTVNTVPEAPAGPASVPGSGQVTLSWSKASDGQTPVDGLFYNLRIGTGPDATDILAPLSDLTTGYPRIQSTGNMSHDTAVTINGLAPGVYYWSVQTLDNGYRGSLFSSPETFTITETATPEMTPALQVYPNPVTDRLHVTLPGDGPAVVKIVNLTGQTVIESRVKGREVTLDVSCLPAGMYFLRLTGSRESSAIPVMIHR